MRADVGRRVNDTQRAVLDALEDRPAAGPKLADELGDSRTAVW
jgi:BirA family biotin operon repressor/biotin-[acetyl-CoA-carboxylase] ligase